MYMCMLLLANITAQPLDPIYSCTVCFYPQSGWTALHMAAQEGKIDVVRLLTEAKAHVNIQSEVCIYIYM